MAKSAYDSDTAIPTLGDLRSTEEAQWGAIRRLDVKVDEGFAKIADKIDRLVNQFGFERRPQYMLVIATVTVAMLILGAIGGTWAMFVKDQVTRLDGERRDQDVRLQAEMKSYDKGIADLMDKMEKRIDGSVRVMEGMLTDINNRTMESIRERERNAVNIEWLKKGKTP